ncbi:hypothetical protein [Micromonospora parathelypteridis]|uniref:PknH-like extracellular domain-containing protein n=2 Tax=Micromonospora parathelypteridis TaxID=1839617 RepID=A0A840VN53_9ACTN|nr:hypothetical protein [Micromonospora parathelypteridis]MBB5477376.1 hypothetical protein [Micromonospora parathelypteridis]
MYQRLAAAADACDLGVPDVLRRRADRRARLRAAGGTLAVALVVGGVAIGTQVVATPPPGTTPSPADTPTIPAPSATAASPSAPPTTPGRPPGTTPASPRVTSASPPETPVSIPDRAFFALASANQTTISPRFLNGDVLPGLCDARYPSESAIVQRRARSLVYKLAETPAKNPADGSVGEDGTYRNTITIYRAGRADDAIDELRRAVRDCPEQETPAGDASVVSRQRLLGSDGYGDESVLFETRKPNLDVNGDPTGGDEVRLVRVIRVGDVVTVLWEIGWETGSSPRTQVDADSRRAVAAIEAWLG